VPYKKERNEGEGRKGEGGGKRGEKAMREKEEIRQKGDEEEKRQGAQRARMMTDPAAIRPLYNSHLMYQ